MEASGRLGAVERGRMAPGRRPGAPQRLSGHVGIRGSVGLTASRGTLNERPSRWRQQQRSGRCGLPQRGAPHCWTGRGGLVLCPRRGAPALENVAASDHALEKASGERHDGIYRDNRWLGAAVKNATTGE
jgi:hypothetical protein